MSGVNRSVAAFCLVLAGALAFVALVAGGDASARGIVDTQEVEITENKRGFPKFDVGDGSIAQGGELTVVNNTDPEAHGPHTISLVPASVIPRTTQEKRSCFGRGRICRAIAAWHEVRGNNVGEESVEAGAEGWDTQGDSPGNVGDSEFIAGEGQEVSRAVTAPVNKSIHMICAIHPGMNGKVKVDPAS